MNTIKVEHSFIFSFFYNLILMGEWDHICLLNVIHSTLVSVKAKFNFAKNFVFFSCRYFSFLFSFLFFVSQLTQNLFFGFENPELIKIFQSQRLTLELISSWLKSILSQVVRLYCPPQCLNRNISFSKTAEQIKF